MKSIYKKIINLVFKIIYGQIYINNDIFKNISLKKIRLKSKYSSFLYIINECRVFTDCNTNVAYIKKNVIIPDISYQQNGNKIADINFNSTLKNGTPKLKKNFNGVVMSLVQGSSGSNYYHWFYDIIPKLEIYTLH